MSTTYSGGKAIYDCTHSRACAPRTAGVLRRVAQAARYVVRPHHCRQFFAHAGYVNSSA
jgi:hypothetical protein